ncbi:hypothetical protein [Nonomuraea sp. NPDC049784]|uniref:hypothetical protein n=1 Tax=Nonomuraea sp. NPDC049784 TaxID=3154361 RepID=UPI0033FD5AB9
MNHKGRFPAPEAAFDLSGDEGFEPLAPSMRSQLAMSAVRANMASDLYRRSLRVRERPNPYTSIVTQFVTQRGSQLPRLPRLDAGNGENEDLASGADRDLWPFHSSGYVSPGGDFVEIRALRGYGTAALS